MLLKARKLTVCAVAMLAAMLSGAASELQARDTRETIEIQSFSWNVTERSDALVLDLLDLMGVEPVDPAAGPMPQTREHIILARQTPATDDSPNGQLEYFVLTTWEAKVIARVLDYLESVDERQLDPYRNFSFRVNLGG